MSMLSNWLHPGRAYDQAKDTVRRGYDDARTTQQPFYDYGLNAGGVMSQQLDRLMNPAELESEWNKSYETSPMALQDIQQATEEGMGAASSMGLMGSSPAIQAIQSSSHNIMNRDRQQFLDDLMKKYMAGLGIGKDMYGIGATTAGNMGQQSIQGAQDEANLQIGKSQADAARFGDIGSSVGNLALNYFTGGM